MLFRNDISDPERSIDDSRKVQVVERGIHVGTFESTDFKHLRREPEPTCEEPDLKEMSDEQYSYNRQNPSVGLHWDRSYSSGADLSDANCTQAVARKSVTKSEMNTSLHGAFGLVDVLITNSAYSVPP